MPEKGPAEKIYMQWLLKMSIYRYEALEKKCILSERKVTE